jgi:hypothetical protein
MAFVRLNGRIQKSLWGGLREEGFKLYVSDSMVREDWSNPHNMIFLVSLCRKGYTFAAQPPASFCRKGTT